MAKLCEIQRWFVLKPIALPNSTSFRGYRYMSYVDRLAKLGLPSLELRRLHLDLIYCYKVVF